MVAIVLCVAGERLYDGVVNIDDDNEDDVDDGVDDSDDVGEMLTHSLHVRGHCSLTCL